VRGYFDGLGMFLDRATGEGFIAPQHRELLIVDSDAEALLDRLEVWESPQVEKWLGDASET
jgi:predicted Rossmann-fold nucleotide-binding protein